MNKLLLGDSLELLKTIESDSVDMLCCDPPYGYSFMGKSWDRALPDIGIFKECLRVLKPGAFAFVMSAPRSDVCSRMMILLEDSGFDIGFTPLYHTYASGFPKAHNVHKNLTKNTEARKHEMQELWRAIVHTSSHTGENNDGASLPILLASMEQGEQYEIHAHAGSEGEDTALPEGREEPGMERGPNLQESEGQLLRCKVCALPLSFSWNGSEGRVCDGTQARDGSVSWTFAHENGSSTSYKSSPVGQSFRKLDVICDECGTQALRTLEGSYGGFQPKPAVEVVIVAMKPLSEKTYVDQALKNGKGITWLDDCRVPIDKETEGNNLDRAGKTYTQTAERMSGVYQESGGTKDATFYKGGGRFPANLLVSDDVLEDHSRFFSLDSWWNAKFPHEAGMANRGGEQKEYNILPFLAVPKASKSEKNEGLHEQPDRVSELNSGGIGRKISVEKRIEANGENAPTQKNHHPTVKPLKLMSYLITLGSRPGDTILDPFVGSGTTAIAAKQLGRQYLAIEQDESYVEIAEARLAAVPNTLI